MSAGGTEISVRLSCPFLSPLSVRDLRVSFVEGLGVLRDAVINVKMATVRSASQYVAVLLKALCKSHVLGFPPYPTCPQLPIGPVY